MKRFGRRAAIGATSLALALAGAGTSLAAVRSAAQHERLRSQLSPLPSAPESTLVVADSRPPPLGPLDGAVELPTLSLGAPATINATGGSDGVGSASPALDIAATPPASSVSPPLSSQAPGVAATVITRAAPIVKPQTTQTAVLLPVVPVAGPTPTTLPEGGSTPVQVCPSDSATGALPSNVGPLRAVDYALPWPALGDVALLPQTGATHAAGRHVRVSQASLGSVAADGQSVTVAAPITTGYVLADGEETARGTISFTRPGQAVKLARRACVGRSFVIHDVAQTTLDRRPLRVVGVVAPAGTVVVDSTGGTARFRSDGAGVYVVAFLTANDAGKAGPMVVITVTVA